MIMHSYMEFEKPVADLEGQLHELRALAREGEAVDVADEIRRLETKARQALIDIYARLTPWQKTLTARHPARPHASDYIARLIDAFTPLCGDRTYAEDAAILAGLGWFRGRAVAVIGQEKGHDTDSRVTHNFGMAHPEGYRKAVRIMQLAGRFGLPVIALVDTAGAYPGIGAEKRGQASAIAHAIDMCLALDVANVAAIIGEGGSGGAIAIATASYVCMLEHSIYSVISPEAGASILWRDSARAKDAATNMKITARDLKALGVIDEVVAEPAGGAHRHREQTIDAVGEAIARALDGFDSMTGDDVRRRRMAKFEAAGSYS